MIKVGVDVRCLAQPLAGIGRYTLEMCMALLERGDVDLYLYSPSQINPIILDQCRGASFLMGHSSNFLNNKIYRQLWSEIYLPLRIRQDSLDVFWGPAHHLPFCLSRNIPSVVTIHDLVWKYAGETMRPLNRLFEKIRMPRAVRKANRIVAVSNATAQDVVEEFGLVEGQVCAILSGKPERQIVPPSEVLRSLGVKSSYCLFVGTIEPRKNLRRLLKAYAQLSMDIKNKAQLVIVGGAGWGKVDLLEIIDELHLADHVIILGYVDDDVLRSLYAHARFLVMPSIYEGFGLPLLEAMVYGTPVMTSNVSSMPEVAGEAGVFVDPLSLQSIKDGLEQIIVDDSLRADLSMKALINADRFSWERAAEQLVDIFKEIIQKSRATAP